MVVLIIFPVILQTDKNILVSKKAGKWNI